MDDHPSSISCFLAATVFSRDIQLWKMRGVSVGVCIVFLLCLPSDNIYIVDDGM